MAKNSTGFLIAATGLSPTASVALCILLVSVIALLAREYRSWKRLAHVPGPRLAHFTGAWLAKHSWDGQVIPCMVNAGSKYGPLVRMAPNIVLCSDPEELARIGGLRTNYTKGESYDATRIGEGEAHLGAERDQRKRKDLKRMMRPAYSVDIQPTVDHHVKELINLIDRKYATNPYPRDPSEGYPPNPQSASTTTFMDFAQKMQFWALDSVAAFCFGEPFGFVKQDEDIRKMAQINDLSLRMVSVVGAMPWLADLRDKWPFYYLAPRAGDKVGFGCLFDFANELVSRRLEADAEPKTDMMQAFMRSGMNKEQLIQQVYLHVIAGSDTSSNWARMTMLSLLTSPPAYMALQREIDSALASGRLSNDGPPTDAELSTLPYLNAVLREALRLHPPSIIPSKLSPSGVDDSVCGFRLPGGTHVGANVPALLRSEAVFGPDAACFRPERWLEAADANDGRLAAMRVSWDLLFGTGRWHCIGKNIAWMEARKVMVELLRNFDFTIVNGLKPLHVEYLAIIVVHNFNVKVVRRVPKKVAMTLPDDEKIAAQRSSDTC